MRVRNLQAWAGLNFSVTAGQIIELPDDVARERMEAGLAEELFAAEPALFDEPVVEPLAEVPVEISSEPEPEDDFSEQVPEEGKKAKKKKAASQEE